MLLWPRSDHQFEKSAHQGAVDFFSDRAFCAQRFNGRGQLVEFHLTAGGEVEMFSRFRQDDCQSTSDARTSTGNGDGLMNGGFG